MHHRCNVGSGEPFNHAFQLLVSQVPGTEIPVSFSDSFKEFAPRDVFIH